MSCNSSNTLYLINKSHIFSESEYSDLHPKGSKTARFYSTPKFNQSFSPGSIPPLRSIFCSIYTYILFPQTIQSKAVLLLWKKSNSSTDMVSF